MTADEWRHEQQRWKRDKEALQQALIEKEAELERLKAEVERYERGFSESTSTLRVPAVAHDERKEQPVQEEQKEPPEHLSPAEEEQKESPAKQQKFSTPSRKRRGRAR